MAVVTSAVLGALTSLAPEVLEYFKRKHDVSKSIELKKLDIQSNQVEYNREKYLEDLRAIVDEGKSLRDHSADLDGKGFINGLRASVRPFITYFFFFLFVAIKVVSIWVLIHDQGGIDTLTGAWTEIYPLIWGEDDKAIFAAVMGFWFGSRAIYRSKLK